jgi:Rod binding domain-containing protein
MTDQISTPLLTSTLFNSGSLASSPESTKLRRDTPEAIAKAASEFESLLIGEVLKSVREADGSDWLGTDENEAGSALMELSEQQLAKALSSAGGLGLAKMISAGLAKTASKK